MCRPFRAIIVIGPSTWGSALARFTPGFNIAGLRPYRPREVRFQHLNLYSIENSEEPCDFRRTFPGADRIVLGTDRIAPGGAANVPGLDRAVPGSGNIVLGMAALCPETAGLGLALTVSLLAATRCPWRRRDPSRRRQGDARGRNRGSRRGKIAAGEDPRHAPVHGAHAHSQECGEEWGLKVARRKRPNGELDQGGFKNACGVGAARPEPIKELQR